MVLELGFSRKCMETKCHIELSDLLNKMSYKYGGTHHVNLWNPPLECMGPLLVSHTNIACNDFYKSIK